MALEPLPIPFHGLHLLPEQVYLSNFWKYTQVYFPKCSTVYKKKSTIHVLLQNMCVYVCCCVHVCTLTNPIYLCWQSALLIFSSYVQFFQSNTIMDQFLLYICRVLFFLHCKESHCTFCLLIWKNYRYGDLRVSLYIPFLYTHLICHALFVHQDFFLLLHA